MKVAEAIKRIHYGILLLCTIFLCSDTNTSSIGSNSTKLSASADTLSQSASALTAQKKAESEKSAWQTVEGWFRFGGKKTPTSATQGLSQQQKIATNQPVATPGAGGGKADQFLNASKTLAQRSRQEMEAANAKLPSKENMDQAFSLLKHGMLDWSLRPSEIGKKPLRLDVSGKVVNAIYSYALKKNIADKKAFPDNFIVPIRELRRQYFAFLAGMSEFFASDGSKKKGTAQKVVNNYLQGFDHLLYNVREIRAKTFKNIFEKNKQSRFNPLPMNDRELFVNRLDLLFGLVINIVTEFQDFFNDNRTPLENYYNVGRNSINNKEEASWLRIPPVEYELPYR